MKYVLLTPDNNVFAACPDLPKAGKLLRTNKELRVFALGDRIDNDTCLKAYQKDEDLQYIAKLEREITERHDMLAIVRARLNET